jgi:hypothetical protein
MRTPVLGNLTFIQGRFASINRSDSEGRMKTGHVISSQRRPLGLVALDA